MLPATMTHYDRIDRTQSVETIVDEFYRRVLLDQELTALFAGIDMASERRHQTSFISMALGASEPGSDRIVTKTRRRCRFTNDHFNRVSRHLHDALAWAGVGPDEERAVLAVVGPLKNDAAVWPYDRSL